MSEAIFAGGCFWCLESDFEKLDGVLDAISGYIGGDIENPSYEEVCEGDTGHYEAVKVIYDPAQITYQQLLDAFWTMIDPTDEGGQFADRGTQYQTAIFYQDEAQKALAIESKQKIQNKFAKPIVTKILPASTFYPAEEYHQSYYRKNAMHYGLYRKSSGRDKFLKSTWSNDAAQAQQSSILPQHEGKLSCFRLRSSTNRQVRKSCQDSTNEIHTNEATIDRHGTTLYRKPSTSEIKNKLNLLQYKVTQECGTEMPFNNEFWDNKRSGIYVDIVTGEPLFSSLDKYDSGSGWPSFTKPLVPENITDKDDNSYGMHRIEVRSKHGDSHLGHLFPDGPRESTGLRYCINSAALKFIPVEELEQEGYGQYKRLFAGQ